MNLGFSLGVNGLFGRSSASGAALLAAGEANALALDFTDDAWLAATGQYGSAWVKDVSTPANDYNSHPYAKLIYTSPSAKMTMGPTGLLRFGAHNLYLNSAAPANQSITVVSGGTYAIDITGTVSVTASGAATGTWTAGTTTFTATTATLTLGSTSGAGTVNLRRTPSDDTYLATTSAARYALPYEWDSGGDLLGILCEPARTNLCLYSDDLTNAAWTKSNLTTAKTATGPDGVANSATTITATAANATALQAITSASAARVTSVWLKRRTGTGNIDITHDNGTTWTTKVVTSSWARYDIGPNTAANPTVGIRVVTSGDAVDVALFDHEVDSFPTSAIPTFGSTVTRAADNISLATSAFPDSDPFTVFTEITLRSGYAAPAATYPVMWSISASTVAVAWVLAGSDDIAVQGGSLLLNPTTNSSGKTSKHAIALAENNSAYSFDGSAVTTDLICPVHTSQTTLYIGQYTDATYQLNGHIRKLMYLPRRMSDAELQAITT